MNRLSNPQRIHDMNARHRRASAISIALLAAVFGFSLLCAIVGLICQLTGVLT